MILFNSGKTAGRTEAKGNAGKFPAFLTMPRQISVLKISGIPKIFTTPKF